MLLLLCMKGIAGIVKTSPVQRGLAHRLSVSFADDVALLVLLICNFWNRLKRLHSWPWSCWDEDQLWVNLDQWNKYLLRSASNQNALWQNGTLTDEGSILETKTGVLSAFLWQIVDFKMSLGVQASECCHYLPYSHHFGYHFNNCSCMNKFAAMACIPSCALRILTNFKELIFGIFLSITTVSKKRYVSSTAWKQ